MILILIDLILKDFIVQCILDSATTKYEHDKKNSSIVQYTMKIGILLVTCEVKIDSADYYGYQYSSVFVDNHM